MQNAMKFQNINSSQQELEIINKLHYLTKENKVWEIEINKNLEQLLYTLKELESLQRILNYEIEDEVDSKAKLKTFRQWLMQNKIFGKFIASHLGSSVGNGLIATERIEKGEKIMEIPKHLMLTANNSYFLSSFPYLSTDPLLKSFPSVSLALYLLHESHKPSSKFGPYIGILPKSFTLPLYFNYEEIILLQGSEAFKISISFIYNVVKQYLYIRNMLKSHQERKIPLPFPLESFSFNKFRWATSVVATRQNKVPSGFYDHTKNSIMTFALIPAWDMCNHSKGSITTYFNEKIESIEMFAMKDFESEDEITIYYGDRTNQDLVVYSGFLIEDNPLDTVHVEIPLDQKENLFPIRKLLLQKQNKIPIVSKTLNRFSILIPVTRYGVINPLANACIRILLMSKVELTNLLRRKNSENLFDTEIPIVNQEEENRLLLESCKRRIDCYFPATSINVHPSNHIAQKLCDQEKKLLQDIIQEINKSH